MLELMLTIQNRTLDNKWRRLSSTSLPPSHGGCAFSSGDYIYYLTGAIPNPTANSKFFRYSITDDTWTELPCPLTYGQLRTCSVVNGKAYFFGGWPETLVTWSYDIVSNTWNQLGNFSYRFYSGMSIAIGTDIYIACGYSGSAPLNRFTRYNTLTDGKTVLQVAPTSTTGGMIFSFDDNTVIVTGGSDNLGNTDNLGRNLYTISTNSWARNNMTGPEHPGGYTAFTQSDGVGYLFGGLNNRTPTDVFSTFNALTYTTVKPTSPQPTARSRASMVYNNDAVYMVGGLSSGSEPLSELWVWSNKEDLV